MPAAPPQGPWPHKAQKRSSYRRTRLTAQHAYTELVQKAKSLRPGQSGRKPLWVIRAYGQDNRIRGPFNRSYRPNAQPRPNTSLKIAVTRAAGSRRIFLSSSPTT